MYNKQEQVVVQYVDFEYADNFLYIDFIEGRVFEGEESRESVLYIDIESLGALTKTNRGSAIKWKPFIMAIYTLDTHPEYFI